MYHIKTVEGLMEAKGYKIAIIASRFNDFMVNSLIGGAVDYLVRHGADKDDLTIVRVPGAFEMPIVTQKLAAETTKGLAHVSLEYGIPVGFGLLTTDNMEQAIERSGSKAGNKGVEAASALLETLQVLKQL